MPGGDPGGVRGDWQNLEGVEVIRRETIHRMTRRRNGWDYCAPGRYMVTLILADRTKEWLGRIAFDADPAYARVELTELGRLIAEMWREIAENWPGVDVEEFEIMPDHLHGILHIVRRQRHPLGQIVGSFKARSTSAARELAGRLAGKPASTMAAAEPPIVPASLLAGSSLWAAGLTDSILYSAERHEHAVAYIADNPRRLAEKRANPGLFTVRRDMATPLPIGPGGAPLAAHFAAIGNHNLLAALDFHQVQCSRRHFAYAKDKWGKPLKDAPPAAETADFRRICEQALSMAADGAVLVNPCISQGEREIARRAFAAGARMIILRNKGFSPLYKPEGTLFDRCAEGRILMLAPADWPFTPAQKAMTRDDACALNRIAQAIAGDGAADIDYKGRTPLFIDEMAQMAVLASKGAA